MRSMGLPLQFGRMSAHKNFEVSISLIVCLIFFIKYHMESFYPKSNAFLN